MTRSIVVVDEAAIADQAVQHRLENTPPALPTQRPRSLTFSNSSINLPLKLSSLNLSPANPKTSFFSLPLEVRRATYHLAFNAPEDDDYSGKSVIQLIQAKKNKLYYVTCPWHGHSWNHTRCLQSKNEREGLVPDLYSTDHYEWCGNLSEGGRERTDGMLRILMVCRQMYREAIDVLYGSHQFYFRHLFTVIDLLRTVLPQRMNAIRSLRLVIPLLDPEVQDLFDDRIARQTGDDETTISKAFKIIANMEGLKELDVEFNGDIGSKPGRKREVLLPLEMVRQAKRFDVKLPWTKKEGNGEEQGEEVPYRLFWAMDWTQHDGEDDSA